MPHPLVVVEIHYPTIGPERVLARDLGDGRAELRRHATFIPIGPGDVVAYDDCGTVVDVVHLEPLWTYEVGFELPGDLEPGTVFRPDHPAVAAVTAIEQQWQRDAWVTRGSNVTLFVSSASTRWLDHLVLSHPEVSWYDCLRTPDLEMDFHVASRHPDVDGTGVGPWK